MSYLLDALNKSKGENSAPTDTPQPVIYQNYSANEGGNIYKWISIVLALILTLILGIVLGNRYTLLGVPQQESAQPIEQTTVAAQPVVTNQQPPAPTATESTATEPNNPAPTPAETGSQTAVAKAQPAPQEQAQSTPTVEQPTPGLQQPQQEFHVVSGEPKKLKPVDQLKDTGLTNISDDLLKKFNQAIKESEGVEADHSQIQSEQTDQELETYFTKVPKITELNTQQQLDIPSMVYETHLYSSDSLQRWVKINGQTLQEQQWINNNIQIVEIQKQFLILEMGHIRFSLPALTDWQAIN